MNNINLQPISNVSFQTFDTLLKYLKELVEKYPDQDYTTIELLGRFVPNMDAIEEVSLASVIEEPTAEAFEQFKSDYSYLMFDESGRSTPSKKHYWKLTERSLNELLEGSEYNIENLEYKKSIAKSMDQQVINAWTLEPLKDKTISTSAAGASKALLFKKFPDLAISVDIKTVENYVCDNFENGLEFLAKLYAYCVKHKSYKHFETFLNHVLLRIDVLRQDTELISDSNKQYLKAIQEVIETINYT